MNSKYIKIRSGKMYLKMVDTIPLLFKSWCANSKNSGLAWANSNEATPMIIVVKVVMRMVRNFESRSLYSGIGRVCVRYERSP